MEQVFVYGTLKRGRANAARLPAHRFVAPATTTLAHPLVIAHTWFVPVLIDEPGEGLRVEGEVIEVDSSALEFLDAFEGVGSAWGYRRDAIAVESRFGSHTAWAYVKDRATLDVVHEGPLSSYPDDPRYIPVEGR